MKKMNVIEEIEKIGGCSHNITYDEYYVMFLQQD